MNKTFTEKLLKELIFEFLESQETWFDLPVKEKKELFGLYRTILQSVHETINNPEVTPVIYARDGKSKVVVEEAVKNLRNIVPEVDRILISIIN
tara:strand:- start:644 stop:925 length:282 start_codon:yes stop_codon:yes gene_type:complete